MNVIAKWSSEDFIKFLDVYQKYEILWNVNTADYTSKSRRDVAYQRLVKDLEQKGFKGLTVDIVKKKLKIIKDIHRQEYMKVIKSKNSDDDEVYKPRLVWYDKANAFLGTIIASRSSSSTAGNSSATQPNCDEDEDDEQQGKSPASPADTLPTLNTRPSEKLSPPPKRFKPNNETTKYFEIAVKNHDSSYPSSADTEDEYDMFAKHVAAQLRTLPTQNFVILQEKIQTLLTAERLSYLQIVTPNCASPDDCSSDPRHYLD